MDEPSRESQKVERLRKIVAGGDGRGVQVTGPGIAFVAGSAVLVADPVLS